MSPAIRMESVTKRYGTQTALEDLSFEVPEGTVFALLGENGAGKTTAIRILLGLSEPDAGTASVLGLDSRSRGLEVRRSVGYVSERPTLYDWMSVDEIGWFTAGFYPEGFLARYRDLIRQFDLPPKRKIRALSRGMRAKVSLSLALAPDPQVLVMDEPTSGLDTVVRREFLESMIDRTAAGKTVLLASHQINEVERVADIVAIVRGGHLLLVESLDVLKAQTFEITVTLRDAQTACPPEPDGVLRTRRRGRHWQLIVRPSDEDSLNRFRHHAGIEEMEVRTPSLEEIFVAYLVGCDEASSGSMVSAQAEAG